MTKNILFFDRNLLKSKKSIHKCQLNRTPKLNSSVENILQAINDLQIFENKKGDNFLDVSLEVLKAGLEPARILLSIGF